MTRTRTRERTPQSRRKERERAAAIKRPLPDLVRGKLCGVSHIEGYPSNLRELWRQLHANGRRRPPVRAHLEREPDNPGDPNAVGVVDNSGLFVGYLPRALAARLVPELDGGADWTCLITHVLVSEVDPNRPGVAVELRRHDD